MNYSSWIEIDLKQFKKNLNIIRSNINNKLFCLPVKANAYGHGLVEISKTAESEGVDYLAVANLLEGIKLRKANIKLPIIVMGPFHEDQIQDLLDHDLEITISSFFKAKLVRDYCIKHNKRCKIHLKVDTGMNRIGVKPKTAVDLYKYLKDEKCFDLVGIFSHFANATDKNHLFNQVQINRFNNFIKKIKLSSNIICHLANSAAISFLPNSINDMVRVAALSFGCFEGELVEKFKDIKSIFAMKSKVSFFKIVEKNSGISYGHSYITKNKTRIVTIPIGYGDGYSRALSNKGSVLIREKKYPIVGSICMDQLMVDVFDDDIFVGDEVVLIGEQNNKKISLHEIAGLLNTITYEILCSCNERLPRVYLN